MAGVETAESRQVERSIKVARTRVPGMSGSGSGYDCACQDTYCSTTMYYVPRCIGTFNMYIFEGLVGGDILGFDRAGIVSRMACCRKCTAISLKQNA